jgi:hypothetical protein
VSAWGRSVAIASLRAKLLTIYPGIDNAPKDKNENQQPEN